MAKGYKMMAVEIVVRNNEKERSRLKKYQDKFRRKEGGRKLWIQ